jgi:4,5-dihydroxyphthalate decarboxylase
VVSNGILVSARSTTHDRNHYRRSGRLNQVTSMLPSTTSCYRGERLLDGQGLVVLGIAANRAALDGYLRCHHEQGLSTRRWTVEDTFARNLLDT